MTIIMKSAKKVLAGIFALTIAFVMTGCSKNPLLTAYEDAVAEANVVLAEAKDLVAIPNQDNITANVVLSTKVVRDEWEASVSWASSNPTVVSTTGVVVRQTANTAVTLTATINYVYNYGGEDTPSASVKVTDTKVFNLTVVAAPVLPTPTTVALAIAASDATSPDSPTFLVEGLVVGINTGAGFYLQDASGAIYIYSSVTVALGDIVRASGHRLSYYGMPQIGTKTASSAPTTSVTVVSSGNPIVFRDIVDGMSIEEFHNLDISILATYGQLFKLRGKLTASGEGDSATYLIEDPFTGRQEEIYGGSSGKASLANYVDENVVISVIPYNFHTSNLRWRVMYSQFPNSIYNVSAPSETDFVVNAVRNAHTSIETEMVSLQTTQLPTTYAGVSYTYSLAAGELNATLNGSALTASDATVATDFVLTVSATKGAATYSFNLEFAVTPLTTITITEFKALANDESGYVRGDVVGVGGATGNNYFWIKDTAGSILRVDDPLGTSVLGDKIVIRATKKTASVGAEAYADNITLIGRVSQSNPLIADASAVEYTHAQLNAKNTDFSILGTYIKISAYVKFMYLFNTSAYNLFNAPADTTTNIQLHQPTLPQYANLYAYEGRVVEVYAFVHSISAATSGGIRLSIQKVVDNQAALVPTSVAVDPVGYVGVGESHTMKATLNGTTFPRALPGDVTWSLVGAGDSERATIDANTGVLDATAQGNVTVRATSVADPTKTAEATVAIGPAPFASEDFEGFTELIPYATAGLVDYTYAGIVWSGTQVGSYPNDATDLYCDSAENLRMLRFRGAGSNGNDYTATLETKNFITGGVSKLVFDAKTYGTSHSTAKLSVYKWEEGVDTDWVLVGTIDQLNVLTPLTASYRTFAFNINATGNVKLKITSGPKTGGKSSNIDNLKLVR